MTGKITQSNGEIKVSIKLTDFLCIAFFILIASTITAGFVYGASNPFLDIINKNKTQPVKENPFLQQPMNNTNKAPPIIQPELPVEGKIKCKFMSGEDFFYMLAHKKRVEITKLYNASDRKMTFIDFMHKYDRQNIKILMVYQQLQFSGLKFECNCGCVKSFEYNHYEVPTHFKVKTSLNLKVDKTSVKCKCGCNQL